MITLFMLVCCVGMRMHFMDILVQFLFPMVVAAGICFTMLNSRALNEAASMLGCFLWKVVHDCNHLCWTMEGNLYETTNS